MAIAGRNYTKNEFVGYFNGEVIPEQIKLLREQCGRRTDIYYYYFLQHKNIYIDATFKGSKLRFILNVCNEFVCNLILKVVFIDGEISFAFFAKRDIKKNDKLMYSFPVNYIKYPDHLSIIEIFSFSQICLCNYPGLCCGLVDLHP